MILGWVCFILSFMVGSGWLSHVVLILAIVGIFGGTFIMIFGGKGKKVKTGPLVVGTLVSIRQTGTYVNEQPQCALTIQFTTQDGKQITAVDKEIISLTNLASLQPGAALPIRYNPLNPQEITIDAKADPKLIEQAKDQYLVATGQVTQEATNIKENGVQAKGVILSSTPTGNVVNGNGELELEVRVTRPDCSTYDVTATKAVPHSGLAYTVPGSVVHVFYMSDDEEKIVIGFYA